MSNSDAKLMANFKMAANSVAMLYKESLASKKEAWIAGYEAALQDLKLLITSHHSHTNSNSIPVALLEQFFAAKLGELQEQQPCDFSIPTQSNDTAHSSQLSHHPATSSSSSLLTLHHEPILNEFDTKRWRDQDSFLDVTSIDNPYKKLKYSGNSNNQHHEH